MSNSKRFLIAGTGAVVPLLINLTVLDLRTLGLDLTIIVIITYVIRQLALFSIGGFVGLMNREEDPLKLIQIGIAAPALITAMLNGNQVRLPNAQAPSGNASTSLSMRINLTAFAYAQELSQPQLKTFMLPQETVSQQISRGLFGSVPENVWFVIAGSFQVKENAVKQAQNFRRKGFNAEVYLPYGNNKNYAVVIGAMLTRPEAAQLQSKAIQAGLPSDAYLWTFPHERDD
jgi:sporulation related protein